jgi:hypothetical protein
VFSLFEKPSGTEAWTRLCFWDAETLRLRHAKGEREQRA